MSVAPLNVSSTSLPTVRNIGVKVGTDLLLVVVHAFQVLTELFELTVTYLVQTGKR